MKCPRSHRPYPLPPKRASMRGVEPSIPPSLLAAIRMFGAERMMTAPVRRRLALSGLSWDQLAPVLAAVRRIEDWTSGFHRAADQAESIGDNAVASAFAYLGQLPISPFHPAKALLREQFRRCHVAHRQDRPGIKFESLQLADGKLACYRETPLDGRARERPTILLFPPLASTKEELTLLADPLLDVGYVVVRMDLPGQGESAGPLTPDAERLLSQAIDELEAAESRGVVAGGISLGAHFALRLAAVDPSRVRAAFGISPMAIRTLPQWASLPEIIYQYMDIYFGTERAETYDKCRKLSLDDVAAQIRCPVRLYHAAYDSLAQVNAPEVYRELLVGAQLSERTVEDRHGCLLHLTQFGEEIAHWCEGLAAA